MFMWVMHLSNLNLMYWGVCVAISHRTGVDIHCTSLSWTLPLGSMNKIRIVTGKYHLNKKHLKILPLLFWPTEKKSITIHCATNGDSIQLSLNSYHVKPCKLVLLLYFVLKMLMFTTSALRDYMYLVCISVTCRLLVNQLSLMIVISDNQCQLMQQRENWCKKVKNQKTTNHAKFLCPKHENNFKLSRQLWMFLAFV